MSERLLSVSVEPPKSASTQNLPENAAPKEFQRHVELEQEKSCNPVALLAVQMWEHMNNYYAFCDKRTGTIQTNPILDLDNQGPQ